MPSLRALVILLLILSLTLFGLRLYSAPLDSTLLGRLVASRVAQGLGDDWTASIGAVRLDFTGGFSPTVSLLDVRLDDESSGVFVDLGGVITTPAIEVLVGASPEFGRIEVVRPFVGVERGKADAPRLSGADFAETVDRALGDIVRRFDDLGISEIALKDGTLVLNGPEPMSFEGIELLARVDASRDGLDIRASVAGRDGRWTVRFAHGVEEGDGEGRWIRLSASDVTVSEFMPGDRAVASGKGLGLPLFPQLLFRLDEDGKFKRGDFRLGVGGGYVRFGDDASVLIDEVLVHLSWAAESEHVNLEASHFLLGDTRIPLHGEVTPPTEAGSTKWGFAVETPGAWIKPRDIKGPPLVLDSALLFGSFDAGAMLLNLDTFIVQAGQTKVTGAGSVEFSRDGPLMALAMNVGPTTVATVKRLWPPMVSPKAREWFIEHVAGGRFTGGRLTVGLDALGFDGDPDTVGWTEDGLRGQFGFENVTLAGIGDLPALRGLSGTGEVRDAKLIIAAEGGSARAPEGGRLTAGKSRFEIPDLREPDKNGDLNLTLSGDVADIIRVAALRPIDATRKLGVNPSDLSGTGETSVSLRFPLEKHFERDDAIWSVAAKLKNFSSSKPISGQTISSADLDVTANASAATIRGKGLLNGLRADIDLVQPLDGSGTAATQGVVFELNTDDLASKGIDLVGIVDGSLRIAVRSREDGRRDVEADLTKAVLKIAPVGWTKGAGVAANVRFVVGEKDGRQIVDNFVLGSEGVRISGDLVLGKGGGLESASFDEFALRESDKGQLAIRRTGANAYTIDFNADRFDGRGLIANLKRGGDPGSTGNASIAFNAKVGRMKGFNNVEVSSVSATLSTSAGTVQSAEITGLSNGRASVRASLQPAGNNRQLNVQMANAGEIFSFLDLYDRMQGGKGGLSATLGPKGKATGRLTVSDLKISEDSELRKILDSSPGLVQPRLRASDDRNVRRVVQSDGTSFQKLSVDFTKMGDRLTVREGTLKGPVLGGTVSGLINLNSQGLDLNGTFVPAYAVNNLFGQIPLLGQLAGGRNGGLLGVTFRVGGTLDSPVLSVNPMSAIAPGIFRKIFEFR